jgi:hypothetical protein
LLNHTIGPLSFAFGLWGFKNVAQIAGDRVIATTTDKTIEEIIVTANCLYIIPVEPLKKIF